MNNKIKSIQVLGSGCPTCKQLFETTKNVAKELGLGVEVEYINDVTKIIEMGVMTSPVLVVDGKPVLMGGGHKEDVVKKVLNSNLISVDELKKACCCDNC